MGDADTDGRTEGSDSAVLEALFTQSPLGLFLFDEQLRVRRYNATPRGLRGIAADQVIGRTFGEVGTGFDTAGLAVLAGETLRTGRSVLRHLVKGRPTGLPEQETTISVSLFRVDEAADGRPGVVMAVEDVTEREAARARLDLLHEAHRRVGTTLDATTTARELADVLVPALADAVTVHILDAVLRGEQRRPGPVDPGRPLRRAAFLAGPGARAEERDAVLETLPFATPFTRTLEDGTPRLLARLDDTGTWPPEESEHARALAAAGVHSLMTVPLAVPEGVLGVLTLYRCERSVPYTRQDLDLAAQVASRAALGIDHASSYTRERNTATALQRHLLPSRTPRLTTVETAHLYLPVTAGGDWFDVIELSGARVGLVVGDVVGHGIEAAATMGRLRTALRTLADLDLEPDEVLTHLDEIAARLARESADDTGDGNDVDGTGAAVATCAYAVYDPATRRLSLASAGHPTPLLVSPAGEPIEAEAGVGAPLGTAHGAYETTTVDLDDGAVLCLYTDGLLAGRDDAPHTLRRVLAHQDRSLSETVDAIAYALADEHAEDDAVLLLARTHGLSEDQVAHWDLPADPSVVSTARALTERQLAAWGLEGVAFETELIVSELVTNAIRYGQGPVQLRLIRDRYLTCEVTDGSSTSPHMRRARDTDEGGRGLYLVMSLSDRWGTRHAARGKTVWSQQALSGGPTAPDTRR
ncbi:SpoIIE family protein phosphatase [Streptomyces sp. TLI_105]|uniref:SpoIIE family protein phosphatase n=1 Tax=Streptomyces sp. TLI_105 TaxID=1881019 RepID=UPI000895E4A1|nr:SpoIIE family protein phosphatase [Streptomyces sp. TLI_105]SEE07951.1 PAS domain S-box-containing protein [Streptomyces sp. TLI_105]